MDRARHVLAGVYGAFLGLTLVKFGNPVILDHLIPAPANGLELVFSPWPSQWVFNSFFGSHFYLGFLFLFAAVTAFKSTFTETCRDVKGRRPVVLILCCLLGWYAWQWLAALDTVNRSLTSATLSQFTMCLMSFLFGFFCLKAVNQTKLFWLGLATGLTIVLFAAFDQHFGGLEATRRMIYEQGGPENYPAEFMARISTGRVFGTLFYPNALAGVILLLAPITVMVVHNSSYRFGNIGWGLAVGLFGYLLAACLYWSGSKSGWLIAAAMMMVVVLRMPLAKHKKWLLLAVVSMLAMGAFGIRFAAYFQRGATSVVARFDYWRAAARVAGQNPWTGSGPGTFQVPYAQWKAPDAEMARLVHNDYLQQASDSGIPGFLLYCGLVLGSVALLYRQTWKNTAHFAVWLGLAAWALHSVVEFGLYIPAIAWPAFTFLGWQLGNEVDTSKTHNYGGHS